MNIEEKINLIGQLVGKSNVIMIDDIADAGKIPHTSDKTELDAIARKIRPSMVRYSRELELQH